MSETGKGGIAVLLSLLILELLAGQGGTCWIGGDMDGVGDTAG